ncbi:MAG: acyltransferase domain-containing protein, partial [Propionibacteriaceae bacterium]|nr:acyltransferase domain-containing protein [Propionibacteriaceae bacterium]
RLFLETSWHALEEAQIKPSSLRGSDTGVYVGVLASSYLNGADDSALADIKAYAATGADTSVVAGRVSYTLGLEGPAVAVNTACSSALAALHLACQALRTGETALALVGGVAAMSGPETYDLFDEMGGVAADGRCKAFSDLADGTSWGEGVGVVVLERLSEARRRGHRVHALVRGSAINQDGASNGLSAPNGPSQTRVIRQALRHAGLTPADIDLVEAHGTGTALGDPIEAQALIEVYGPGRPAERPLRLGSVKSNIGHTMAAAGMAGLLKVIAGLSHETMPATLWCDPPTTQIDWSTGVALLAEARPWPKGSRVRRAGVSAFGVSGTNAHVILEEAPPVPAAAAALEPPSAPEAAAPPALIGPGAHCWILSARGEDALSAQAAHLAEWVRNHPEQDAGQLGWSLTSTRQLLPDGAAVIAAEPSGLLAGLDALGAGERWRPADADFEIVTGRARRPGRTVFVYPGQGGQWAGMGRQLLELSPVFAGIVDRCDQAVLETVGWSIRHALSGGSDAPDLGRVDVVQPVLFAMMAGLTELWKAVGIQPDAVIGHSQGEIAAAVAAGILSVEQGARVVAQRSASLTSLAGKGLMALVGLPAAEVGDLLAAWPGQVELAAVNSPTSVVVSGDAAAVEAVLAECERRLAHHHRINVDYASHSRHVEALRAVIPSLVGDVQAGQASVPFYSTVDDAWLDGPQLTGEYWYRNLRETVRFEPAVRRLAEAGYDLFVEVSPHPVLTTALSETLESAPGSFVTGTLRRQQDEAHSFLAALAGLALRGQPVGWPAVFGPAAAAPPLPLPGYAFQHTDYWLPRRNSAGGGEFAGPVRAPKADRAAALRADLAALEPALRRQRVLDLVLGQTAAVLPQAKLQPDSAFQDLGLSSLGAVELRNRLNSATGLTVPTTMVYEFPTPQAAAEEIIERLGFSDRAATAPSPLHQDVIDRLLRFDAADL